MCSPTLPTVLLTLAARIPDRREAAHLRLCATGARSFDVVDAEDLLATARGALSGSSLDLEEAESWEVVAGAARRVVESFGYAGDTADDRAGREEELEVALRLLGVVVSVAPVAMRRAA